MPSSTRETSQEIVKALFSDDDLREIKSFADVGALINARGIAWENYSDYGTGFKVLATSDKSKLIDVPFVILEYRLSKGDNGEFVSLLIVTKDDQKLVVNDGSTGIKDQIKQLVKVRTAAGLDPNVPIFVENGLRVSEYDYVDGNGETKRAKTYYLA